MECSYCKNTFSSKSVLNNHIKTAKYCLKLQNKEKSVNQDDIRKCNGCGKIFTTKFNFQRHIQNCDKIENMSQIIVLKAYNKNLIDKLDEKESLIDNLRLQIKDLQDKLEHIAIKAVQRPMSTTKNTQINYIHQLQPLTDEHLVSNVPNLTIDHIIKGPAGYAEYALEYPLKDRMICSDYSRRKVKFKDKDGNVITDPEMTTLTKKFFESIKEKNKELISKYANELKEKLGDENIMDTIVKLFEYKDAINRGCDGEKTEFQHNFVKRMCSKTVKEI